MPKSTQRGTISPGEGLTKLRPLNARSVPLAHLSLTMHRDRMTNKPIFDTPHSQFSSSKKYKTAPNGNNALEENGSLESCHEFLQIKSKDLREKRGVVLTGVGFTFRRKRERMRRK